MATAAGGDAVPKAVLAFQEHLLRSTRVLALLGAGLSASSGLPTFRGAGGMWRTHDSTSLATPEAFARDPGLVWQFYSYRRHKALQAHPNAAHYALAALARTMPGFLTISQNVDGLSQRAGHPREQLQLLHGTLFEVKCSSRSCGHVEANFTDPIVPALALPTDGQDPTTNEARRAIGDDTHMHMVGTELDISDIKVKIPHLTPDQLPQCTQCGRSLLRPGVVWFGESLPEHVLNTVDYFVDDRQGIDLIMVIGTSAKVYPAAGYIQRARENGARVCVINMDPNDIPPGGWREGDWMFEGDAAQVVPDLLGPIIGDVQHLVHGARG